MENTMTISMTVAPRVHVIDDARRDRVALPQADSGLFGLTGGSVAGAGTRLYVSTIKNIDLNRPGFPTHQMWPSR